MTGVQEYVPLHPLAAPEAEFKGANKSPSLASYC